MAKPVHASGRDILIKADGIMLDIPVIEPGERRLLSDPKRLFSDLYLSRSSRRTVRILNDISFELAKGGRLGLIGANGAGKSTLLRLIAGIYTPTAGAIRVHGTARGLFDLSLGMIGEATGLENIYLRGLQMGLSLRQIKDLVPEVLSFSELEGHIDRPLGTYSTGMRLRLAIAVSTMIEPDILLLDEWIGAGDAAFNEKVKARMMGLVDGSFGLVLATHNVGLMTSLCTHGLCLERGAVTFSGSVEDALAFYKERQAQAGSNPPRL